MKLKPNLNVETMKRVLIQHGEKIAFGLAACILLWFFWQTVMLETLGAEKDSGQLTSLAERARQYVINSPWNPAARNIRIEDYPARAKHVDLSEADYPPLSAYLDKPLWAQHEKRPIPTVLPVEELLAHARQGILAIKRAADDPARAEAEVRSLRGASEVKGHGARLSNDSVPHGFYYVAVTGLVPWRKQSAAFEESFRHALKWDPARDQPKYQYAKVERAEVTGASLKGIAWEEIDGAAVGKFMRTWAGEPVNDVVEDDYLSVQTVTMLLGPLLGEDWDPAIVGHPKIPLAERLTGTKKTDKEAAAPAERGIVWGSQPPTKSVGTAPKATPQPKVADAAPAGPKREHKLFRFIDYTVKPGKQYRYRVKLVLENPNLGLADRFLKEPDLARAPALETDWSEPTPVVTVPRGYSIYAGPVNVRPSVPPRDPEVEALVVGFECERGGEPAAKKLVQRGALLNVSAKELWVMQPDRSGMIKWDKVDIRSNALVVDVQGGRKIGRDKSLVAPIEMLVLDADGHASVHDEFDDADAYHARLNPPETDKKDTGPPTTTTTPATNNPYEKMDRGRARPDRSEKSPTPRGTRAPKN